MVKVKVGTAEDYAEMFGRFMDTLTPGDRDEIRSEMDLQAKLAAWMQGNPPTRAQTDALLGGGGRELISGNIELQKRDELKKAPPKLTRAQARRAWKEGVMSIPYAKRIKRYSYVHPYTNKAGKRTKGYWRLRKQPKKVTKA